MSDPIVDAFIDSFLEKVCASGDAVKVAFAVDRVIRGGGLKKEALAPMTSTYAQRPMAKPTVTPAPFTPPSPVPSPATVPAPVNFSAGPRPIVTAPPITPAARPGSVFGSPSPYSPYPSVSDAAAQQNAIRPPAPRVPESFGSTFLNTPKPSAAPSVTPRPAPAAKPEWAPFYKDPVPGLAKDLVANPQAQLRRAIQDYVGRTGASKEEAFSRFTSSPAGGKADLRSLQPQLPPTADTGFSLSRATESTEFPNSIRRRIADYAQAGAAANAQADLADEKAQNQRASEFFRNNDPGVQTMLGMAGRAKDLVSGYPSALAAQQKTEADARAAASAKIQGGLAGFAGKAKEFAAKEEAKRRLAVDHVTGLAKKVPGMVGEIPGMLARGQQTQANAAAAVQAEAVKRKDLERQLAERETNYDKQDSVLRTSHDNQVDEGLAKLRAQLAGIDSGIESGPIPKFKNLPQLVAPSEGNTPEAQAKRQALVSQIAQLEGSRLRQKAPEVTDAAGMEAQKKMILDSIAARKAQRAPSASSTAAAAKTQGEVEDRRSAENQIRSSNAQRKAYELAKEMSTAKPNPRMP